MSFTTVDGYLRSQRMEVLLEQTAVKLASKKMSRTVTLALSSLRALEKMRLLWACSLPVVINGVTLVIGWGSLALVHLKVIIDEFKSISEQATTEEILQLSEFFELCEAVDERINKILRSAELNGWSNEDIRVVIENNFPEFEQNKVTQRCLALIREEYNYIDGYLR